MSSKIQVSSVRTSIQGLIKASEEKRRNFNETVELQSESTKMDTNSDGWLEGMNNETLDKKKDKERKEAAGLERMAGGRNPAGKQEVSHPSLSVSLSCDSLSLQLDESIAIIILIQPHRSLQDLAADHLLPLPLATSSLFPPFI